MSAVHAQRFQVRFDECGPDGSARSSTILRYVVETAFGHSAAAGYPLSWYFSHGLFWLVRQVHLSLALPVGYADALEITTQVLGARRVWARRGNTVRNGAGVAVGAATMDWILTDRDGRPARIPCEMATAFSVVPGTTLERYAAEAAPAGARTGAYRVPAHQTDPRGHMNNAAYLDLLDDALAALGLDPQARPAEYDLAYLQAAVSGDALQYAAWATPAAASVAMHRPDGTPVWWGRRRCPATAP
ncbi:MAG TPA: acyl-ACP thioesterase domain-containing protein [bacterium]|nr:acyl-ACP thioesterase domain-containing protein [bacterium]